MAKLAAVIVALALPPRPHFTDFIPKKVLKRFFTSALPY